MLPFSRVTIIGLGLIGSSIARAVREHMPTARVTGYDGDPGVRERSVVLGFCHDVADSAGAAAAGRAAARLTRGALASDLKAGLRRRGGSGAGSIALYRGRAGKAGDSGGLAAGSTDLAG